MYRKRDDIFENFLKGMDKEMQAQLRYWYTHSMMLDEINRKKEYEQLKQEIIEEVLARISVSVDITEAVAQIKKLQDEIDKLGK